MKPAKRKKTRRTGGLQTQGRAARVVDDVLRFTAVELGRVGFAGLRIEDVATLSGVNKTTIYRRWPTRADLVAAALHRFKAPHLAPSDSLRESVMDWFRQMVELCTSPIGSGLVRMIQTERNNPELLPIAQSMRVENLQRRRALVEHAIKTGELPADSDADVISDLLFAPVVVRLINGGELVDEAYMLKIVDFVLGPPKSKKRRFPKREADSDAYSATR